MVARKVFGDTECLIPAAAITYSIKGMKVELHALRWTLTRHKQCEKERNSMKFYASGADMARRVIRMEQIIKDMEVVELRAKLKELTNAA